MSSNIEIQYTIEAKDMFRQVRTGHIYTLKWTDHGLVFNKSFNNRATLFQFVGNGFQDRTTT